MWKLSVFLGILIFLASVDHSRSEDGKIVGGQVTDISNVPYQVAIERTYYFFYMEQVCGGSIISEYWVLTVRNRIVMAVS